MTLFYFFALKIKDFEREIFFVIMVMKHARVQRKTILLLLVTQIGRFHVNRPTNHICRHKICFVRGPSQYKFRDAQQIEEKIALSIQ
jgi:hypothetical protein